jgi:hypothetical protein
MAQLDKASKPAPPERSPPAARPTSAIVSTALSPPGGNGIAASVASRQRADGDHRSGLALASSAAPSTVSTEALQRQALPTTPPGASGPIEPLSAHERRLQTFGYTADRFRSIPRDQLSVDAGIAYDNAKRWGLDPYQAVADFAFHQRFKQDMAQQGDGSRLRSEADAFREARNSTSGFGRVDAAMPRVDITQGIGKVLSVGIDIVINVEGLVPGWASRVPPARIGLGAPARSVSQFGTIAEDALFMITDGEFYAKGTLDGGRLDLTLSLIDRTQIPTRRSAIRGKAAFDQIMSHFGDQVKTINGLWIDHPWLGDNFQTFKAWEKAGANVAAMKTFTGKMASRWGFQVRSVTLVNESTVEPIFERLRLPPQFDLNVDLLRRPKPAH